VAGKYCTTKLESRLQATDPPLGTSAGGEAAHWQAPRYAVGGRRRGALPGPPPTELAAEPYPAAPGPATAGPPATADSVLSGGR
jgi:hypothetical protein